MPTFTKIFTADSSGNSISFSSWESGIILDDISLRQITLAEEKVDLPVSEFLTGTTDNGNEVFLRVDTNEIEFSEEFEKSAKPIAIETGIARGALVKCFVALEDGDFYELQGNTTKGVSTLKIHGAKGINTVSPPSTSIRISWRESSKQLCRIVYANIVYALTNFTNEQ